MTKQKTGPRAVYIKQLTAQRKGQKKKTGYPAIRAEHCVEVFLRNICSMNLKECVLVTCFMKKYKKGRRLRRCQSYRKPLAFLARSSL